MEKRECRMPNFEIASRPLHQVLKGNWSMALRLAIIPVDLTFIPDWLGSDRCFISSLQTIIFAGNQVLYRWNPILTDCSGVLCKETGNILDKIDAAPAAKEMSRIQSTPIPHESIFL